MPTLPHIKIVILEDDDFYNRLLYKTIDSAMSSIKEVCGFTYKISAYTSFMDYKINFDPDTHIIFTDYFLKEGFTATQVIEFARTQTDYCDVVVISQFQNHLTTLYASLLGAYEFVKKDSEALKKCEDIAQTIVMNRLQKNNWS